MESNVTVKGRKPTPMKVRLTIARLMQLHYETHPKRVAVSVGLSPRYCQRLWAQMDREEWPDNRIALAVFAEMRRNPEVYSEADESSEESHPDPRLCGS